MDLLSLKFGNGTTVTEHDRPRLLRRALAQLRWTTIAALLLVTLVQPVTGRAGLSSWGLILLFAGYSLLVELLRDRIPWLNSCARMAMLDVPVVALLYFLSADPGGPLFLLFFLGIDCATVSMTLRRTMLYIATVATVVVAIETTFLLRWSPGVDLRMLLTRLGLLALVGLGMALLTRRLAMEQQAALSLRDVNEQLLLSALR